MKDQAETLLPEPERTPAAYWRDLYRARLVKRIAKLHKRDAPDSRQWAHTMGYSG